MFTPHQAAIFSGQLHDLIRDLAQRHFLFRIAHIQRRAHMQNPCIDVTEHTVGQLMVIQQCTEFHNKISQFFRRNRRVFGKCHRFFTPWCITQQTYGFFTHGINSFDTGQIFCDLIANDTGFTGRHQFIQFLAQSLHFRLLVTRVGTGIFDNV